MIMLTDLVECAERLNEQMLQHSSFVPDTSYTLLPLHALFPLFIHGLAPHNLPILKIRDFLIQEIEISRLIHV